MQVYGSTHASNAQSRAVRRLCGALHPGQAWPVCAGAAADLTAHLALTRCSESHAQSSAYTFPKWPSSTFRFLGAGPSGRRGANTLDSPPSFSRDLAASIPCFSRSSSNLHEAIRSVTLIAPAVVERSPRCLSWLCGPTHAAGPGPTAVWAGVAWSMHSWERAIALELYAQLKGP
jgi:hypothetical protein